MSKQQLGVCPYMIMSKTRDQVFSGPTDDAFDASRFQCLGELCMTYRFRYVDAGIKSNGGNVGFCGMINSNGGLPDYHTKHLQT